MIMKVYNSLTRKKEEFKPFRSDLVRIYSCGPTVYWFQHIGNLRTYIFSDILKRVLRYNGFKVKHIINVTDVGHLTSDADSGEDKIEKAAKKEGKKAEDIANYYFDVFKTDLKKLNIIEPDIWCKATEHLNEQIELIKKLEEKGYTYKTDDGIYFDSSKFGDYGKFAKLNLEGLDAGKRTDLRDKRNKTDFALWKFSEIPGERQQEWDSPWGVGFPGWHIECSAMSSKYLGNQFDIHTGGTDHITVHHQNEIAQSECAFGVKPWVKYWMHGAFLIDKDGKMSKSKGKIFTISDLEKINFSALDYRYFCLLTHYRKQLVFSVENLESAKKAYERLKNIISELKDEGEINKKYILEFEKEINDDLNIPGALQVLWKLVRDSDAKGKIKTIEKMNSVIGLELINQEKIKIPKEITELAEKRERARKEKNWKLSDELRDKISELGWIISDGVDGYKLQKNK
jgi:cysteinyl-tRNA synthetase